MKASALGFSANVAHVDRNRYRAIMESSVAAMDGDLGTISKREVTYTHPPALRGLCSWGHIPQTLCQQGTLPLWTPNSSAACCLSLNVRMARTGEFTALRRRAAKDYYGPESHGKYSTLSGRSREVKSCQLGERRSRWNAAGMMTPSRGPPVPCQMGAAQHTCTSNSGVTVLYL